MLVTLQVTNLYLVPPVMVQMAKSPLVSRYDLSSIRQVSCGAAPLSGETILQFKQVTDVGRVRQGIISCYLCSLVITCLTMVKRTQVQISPLSAVFIAEILHITPCLIGT